MSKRETWDDLSDPVFVGDEADWAVIHEVLSEARGSVLIAEALEPFSVLLPFYHGGRGVEVRRVVLPEVVDPEMWSCPRNERQWQEVEVQPGWRLVGEEWDRLVPVGSWQ